LALSLIAGICRQDADAQNAPLGGFSTQVATTVSAANGFSNPSQLAANAGRQSCLIQYIGAATTATGYIFFGPTAPSVTSTSFQLTSRQTIGCGSGDGTVDNNAVWIAGTNVGDLFIIKVK